MGQTYQYTVVATDEDRDHLQYFVEAGPAGLVIDHESGELLWNPLPGTPDQVPVKVRVYEEPLGTFATQEFTISVTDANQPPVLQPIGNRRAIPGQTVSFTLAGSDPEGATVTYFASNLPEGATFDPKIGRFTWTPTAQQTGAFLDLLFAVSDGTRSDHEYVAITVSGSSGTLDSFDRPDLASGGNVSATVNVSGELEEGSEVTAAVNLVDGVPPGTNVRYTFQWAAGAVPDPSSTHVYDDNGDYEVTALVWDADTGFFLGYSDPKTIHIDNVAPTAKVANNGPVDVNYPVTISVSQQHDVSMADTQAGFKYTYIWGDGGVDAAITDAVKTHNFAKSGTYLVKVRMQDKDQLQDGTFTEYTKTVVVNAPYYGYTVIATTSDQFTDFGDSPSINNKGEVAFTGTFRLSSGEEFSGIFVSDGNLNLDPTHLAGTTAHLTRFDSLSTRDFGRAVSINDEGVVAGRLYVLPSLGTYPVGTRLILGPFGIPILVPEYVTIADPPATIIRTWQNGPNDTVITNNIAEVGGRRDAESLAAVLQGKPDVESLLVFTDINSAGDVVYTYTFQYDYQHQLYTLYVGPRDPDAPRENVLADLPYGTFTRPQLTNRAGQCARPV